MDLLPYEYLEGADPPSCTIYRENPLADTDGITSMASLGWNSEEQLDRNVPERRGAQDILAPRHHRT